MQIWSKGIQQYVKSFAPGKTEQKIFLRDDIQKIGKRQTTSVHYHPGAMLQKPCVYSET